MKVSNVVMIVLFFVSGVFYYVFVDGSSDIVTAEVVRVIDGDTVDLDIGRKVRLMGINTPERSMDYYDEASDFLAGYVGDGSVDVDFYGYDKYGRILGYVFVDGVNVNREVLAAGLGTLYYYEWDEYYADMVKAEDFARVNEYGIWRRSSDYGCIELVELEVDEPERLVLRNVCDRNISVTIKDDATHIYREVVLAGEDFEMETSHIWNTDGDSLYVWDSEGLLVFYRY